MGSGQHGTVVKFNLLTNIDNKSFKLFQLWIGWMIWLDAGRTAMGQSYNKLEASVVSMGV